MRLCDYLVAACCLGIAFLAPVLGSAQAVLQSNTVAGRELQAAAGEDAKTEYLFNSFLNTSGDHISLSPQCLQKDRKLDIVLCHFKEPFKEVNAFLAQLLEVPYIKAAQPCVHFVHKGRLSISEIKRNVSHGMISVFKQPNIGRESFAFLQYIITMYSNLPHQVILTQAVPDLYDLFFYRTHNLLTPSTGMLPLGNMWLSECKGSLMKGHMVRLREMWALAKHTFCSDNFAVFGKGQLAVSGLRIASQPVDFYKYLFKILLSRNNPIHQDYKHLDETYVIKYFEWSQRSMHDSLFSHVLERSWTILFNCTERAVVDNCFCGLDVQPCQGSCQCTDSV